METRFSLGGGGISRGIANVPFLFRNVVFYVAILHNLCIHLSFVTRELFFVSCSIKPSLKTNPWTNSVILPQIYSKKRKSQKVKRLNIVFLAHPWIVKLISNQTLMHHNLVHLHHKHSQQSAHWFFLLLLLLINFFFFFSRNQFGFSFFFLSLSKN